MKTNWTVIKHESAYETALKRIKEIFHAEKDTPEYDELELLSILVDEYENKTINIPESDPINIIYFIMDQRKMKQTDLIGILGDKTNVSKILNRKRPLTLEMIRRFSKAFNVSADLLIKEYSLAC